MLTINALAAADSVLIPCQANYLSTKGLKLLMGSVAKVRRQINPVLKIDGILLTMVDSRTNNAKSIISALRQTGSNLRVFGYRDTLFCPGGGVQRVGQEHFCPRRQGKGSGSIRRTDEKR